MLENNLANGKYKTWWKNPLESASTTRINDLEWRWMLFNSAKRLNWKEKTQLKILMQNKNISLLKYFTI